MYRLTTRGSLVAGLILAAPASAAAQGAAFQTPGMPRTSSGQTDRFSNEFNPAIGIVIDALGDYTTVDGASDGFDFTLRSLELSANAYVDPSVWAYGVIVGDEDDVELEEAAAHYVGWEGNATLRAGRFFVDFGKQMQIHAHDLPYFDRPGVLRAYLGEELAGTGVEFDNWFSAGDETAVRYSIGVFGSLTEDHEHGEPDDDDPDDHIDISTSQPSHLDDLAYTARISAFRDVGEQGTVQLGLSLRSASDLTFEIDPSGDSRGNQSNQVYGVDLTYGWQDDTGNRAWTLGGEFLVIDGDLDAELDDAGTPGDRSDDTISGIYDDHADGLYLWTDYRWNPWNSTGLLWSHFEHRELGKPKDDEITLYWTHYLSEFSRLRLGVSALESDADDDEVAFVVQWTNFIGAHSHGVNW